MPIIGIIKRYRGQGIAGIMMNTLISYLRKKGFEKLSLETWQGSPAQNFYQKNRFMVNKVVNDRNGGVKSVKMFRLLGEIDSEQDSFYTSTLEYHKELSRELCIDLFIKRDDLYPKFGGGNKARKLDFILDKARNQNYNSVVTAGGAQSNHCRATALYAASLGWKTILIIHGDKPERYEGNLKLMELSGAEIRFVKQADVKEAMDNAISDLEKEGLKPYYIWGGGHSVEGALAFYEAVKELRSQLGNTIPDYLMVASGTGTTQAGLEIGIRHFYPECKVIGVSVAREEKRGKEEILKSMRELNEYLDNRIDLPDTITFDTSKCGVGYETVFPELIETVQEAIKKGLVLDPTYSGKAFYGMKSFIEEGTIEENSNVVFWHTGGLMNLLSSSAV
ncbi:D-cysteine desulfhydrase [Salegentibacter agarivorans]|uniref:D-cysteine desulfhydrase n=1 Tax=Salegentibacter agarivorans TaxID=345907 RepID=A0A1I2K1J5_9FLAO|nr:pyridoxal-phosphate dependent enzyme [Salegentibacter agarivorans]SFF60168.1 D-cysteine desulfhydrase [Salegentibacter agarivorans]